MNPTVTFYYQGPQPTDHYPTCPCGKEARPVTLAYRNPQGPDTFFCLKCAHAVFALVASQRGDVKTSPGDVKW